MSHVFIPSTIVYHSILLYVQQRFGQAFSRMSLGPGYPVHGYGAARRTRALPHSERVGVCVCVNERERVMNERSERTARAPVLRRRAVSMSCPWRRFSSGRRLPDGPADTRPAVNRQRTAARQIRPSLILRRKETIIY